MQICIMDIYNVNTFVLNKYKGIIDCDSTFKMHAQDKHVQRT